MSEEKRHPFLNGLSKHRGAPPTIIIIFGASGDLTKRKLIPAIYNLLVDNLLPNDFYLFGFGRSKIEDSVFRDQTCDSISKYSRRSFNSDIWGKIEENTFYHAGAYDDPETYNELAQRVNTIEKELDREVQLLFYISTHPSIRVLE